MSRRLSRALVCLLVATALPVLVDAGPAGATPTAGDDATSRAAVAVRRLDDRQLALSRGWTLVRTSAAYQRTLSRSSTAGATATTRVRATRGGVVVLQAGPGRGTVSITVGRTTTRISTTSTRVGLKRVSFSGAGSVRITVGSPGRGVYLDEVRLNPAATTPPAHATGSITPVSVTATGQFGNGTGVSAAAVSPDGRYLAFWSNATNLVSGVTDGADHLYLKSLSTGSLRVLDTAQDGTLSNDATSTASSRVVTWSPDSTEVLFSSSATNLGLTFNPGFSPPYLYTKAIGDGSVGAIASDVTDASWSPDRSTVAFTTYDGVTYCALVRSSGGACSGGLANFQFTRYVFAVRFATATTPERWYAVSADASGALYSGTGPGSSSEPSFSADSGRIAFTSENPAIVGGDTNSSDDVFVKTLASSAVARVSTTSTGAQLDDDSSTGVFSPDGTRIAFTSASARLASGDDNSARDVFVKTLSSGRVAAVSTTAAGRFAPGLEGSRSPSWSPDGTRLLYVSGSVGLAPGADRNVVDDVYVTTLSTRATQVVSATPGGVVGNARSTVNGLDLRPTSGWARDGSSVFLITLASNFATGDGNDHADVYRKALR